MYDQGLSTVGLYLGPLYLNDKAIIQSLTLPRRHGVEKQKEILSQGKSRTLISVNQQLSLTIGLALLEKSLLTDLDNLFYEESFTVVLVDLITGEESYRFEDCTMQYALDSVINEGTNFTLSISVGGHSDIILKKLLTTGL